MSSAFDIRKCFALAISSLAVSAWRFAQQSCAAMKLRDPAYQKKHRMHGVLVEISGIEPLTS